LLGLSKVPPFPPIAARLLVLLSNESVQIGEVAELVGSDPTFSARLLQCVNSVEFGLEFPVSDVGRSLALLGLDRTRQATVTVATAAYTRGALRTKELRRCWEHTVATAILADHIAQACGIFTDNAYTAGIMHDIGRLGLLVAYPKEYERIIRDAADQCLDLLDFEREQFGVHHAEAGRLLAERWGLPEEFRIIAGRHHDPCEGGELDLLRIVHVACRLADALGYDITRPLLPPDVEVVLAELPARARERFQKTPDELRARIEERIRMYDGDEVDSPLQAAPSELATVIQEEAPLLPTVAESSNAGPNSILRTLVLYAAAVFITAVIAYSTVLLWR
jgi:putative nucleotidyltransferase with HDIG domain